MGEQVTAPRAVGILILFLFAAAALLTGQSQPEYVFGFLRAHPERAEIPADRAQEIQKLHMAHLNRMASQGHLVAAGPLGDSPDLRGVLLFKGITVDQARQLASGDPAVVNKRLVVDVAPWPGPPGIGAATAAKLKANPQAEFNMTRHVLVVYWKTPSWPANLNSDEVRPVLTSHIAFMEKLQASGQVIAVGPLVGSKDFVGVAIYKTEDKDEALKACVADPFVKSSWARPQALVWYHSADTFDKP